MNDWLTRLVDALADWLAEMDAKTLRNSLAEVRARPVLDALADWPNEVDFYTLNLAKVHAETKIDTLSKVKAEAIVDVLTTRNGGQDIKGHAGRSKGQATT